MNDNSVPNETAIVDTEHEALQWSLQQETRRFSYDEHRTLNDLDPVADTEPEGRQWTSRENVARTAQGTSWFSATTKQMTESEGIDLASGVLPNFLLDSIPGDVSDRLSVTFHDTSFVERSSQILRRDSERLLAKLPPVLSEKQVLLSQDKKEMSKIEGWSSEPKPLQDFNFLVNLVTLGDIIVTLTPVTFIVLSILAAKQHNQATENNQIGATVARAMNLGPTIFPILFAAVAGRTMKIMARFYAERGTKLGLLELFISSQTVWGTCQSQVMLRTLTPVGIFLLLLWCLSPLGSQATLRVMRIGVVTTVDSTQLLFYPTGGISREQARVWSLDVGNAAPIVATNAVYLSALLSNHKGATQDTWGNVKIPWIQSLKEHETSDGWTSVPTLAPLNTSSEFYSSLVGIPVAGLTNTGTTNFAIESAHVVLECQQGSNYSLQDSLWIQQLGQVWGSQGREGVYYNAAPGWNNLSLWELNFFLDTSTPWDKNFEDNFFVGTDDPSYEPPLPGKRNLLFGSKFIQWGWPWGGVTLRNCTVEMEYVESEVQCHGELCAVQRMRASQQYNNRNPYITPFDQELIASTVFSALPLAAGQFTMIDCTPTEYFLRGATSVYPSVNGAHFGPCAAVPMVDVPNDMFAKRLGSILNTYYAVATGFTAFVGNLPTPASGAFGPFNNGSDSILNCSDCQFQNAPFWAQSTVGTTSYEHEIYVCDFLWLGLLLTASFALLMVAIVGSLMKQICRAPDMLGYVTSMTYNNAHMRLPAGGPLDGMERARLLKEIRVQLGDTTAANNVGHVAFARMVDKDAEFMSDVGRLSQTKLYV